MVKYPLAMRIVPAVVLAATLAAAFVMTESSRDDPARNLYVQAREVYEALDRGDVAAAAAHIGPEGEDAARRRSESARRMGGARSLVYRVAVGPRGRATVVLAWAPRRESNEVLEFEDEWAQAASGDWLLVGSARKAPSGFGP